MDKVDAIYDSSIKGLPISERILYCERLIDKIQLSLVRNKRLLSKTIEMHLSITLRSAQEELKTLRKSGI